MFCFVKAFGTTWQRNRINPPGCCVVTATRYLGQFSHCCDQDSRGSDLCRCFSSNCVGHIPRPIRGNDAKSKISKTRLWRQAFMRP